MQNGSVLLADLVDVLDRVAQADRRAEKVSDLSELLRRTPIEDVEGVVAVAVGTLRPAHDISGWTSTLSDEFTGAPNSSLTVDDVRRVAEAMSIASGPQAVEAAAHSVVDILQRATESRAAVHPIDARSRRRVAGLRVRHVLGRRERDAAFGSETCAVPRR